MKLVRQTIFRTKNGALQFLKDKILAAELKTDCQLADCGSSCKFPPSIDLAFTKGPADGNGTLADGRENGIAISFVKIVLGFGRGLEAFNCDLVNITFRRKGYR